MRETRVPLIAVLNAAFDDTLDYWFLCVPAAVYVLLGAIVLPNVVRGIDALPLGAYKAQIAGGLLFVALVVNVLLNVFGNFITVTAWLNRDRGRAALRQAYDVLRANLWRCVWAYAMWFVLYFAYVLALYLIVSVIVMIATLGTPLPVAVAAYVVLAGCLLYIAWRLVRLLVAVQYLPVVLALTPDRGRRAVTGAILAMRKRFWLSLLLPLVTFAPALIPDLIVVKGDWRLHSFVSCIFGGFFAAFGTLVTLRIYRWPRVAEAERRVVDEDRPPAAALVQA